MLQNLQITYQNEPGSLQRILSALRPLNTPILALYTEPADVQDILILTLQVDLSEASAQRVARCMEKQIRVLQVELQASPSPPALAPPGQDRPT